MRVSNRSPRDEEAIMATKSTSAKSGDNTVVAELVLIQSVLCVLDELISRLESRATAASAS